MGQQVNAANTQLIKNERAMDQCGVQSSSSQCHVKQDGLPQLQQISHNLATDLYSVSHCNKSRQCPLQAAAFTTAMR